MHTNGLRSTDALGMHPQALADALARTAQPNLVGAGMVLAARGNVYGDVARVAPATVARRRAANKAARAARRAARR